MIYIIVFILLACCLFVSLVPFMVNLHKISIAKRSLNFATLCLYAFVPLQLRALSALRGETPENENEPKTNPNEPNFSDTKPRSKRNNGDFRQIQNNLFMQNEPNGMLILSALPVLSEVEWEASLARDFNTNAK